MARSGKQARITLALGLVCGLALVLGVIVIFDMPANTVLGVLLYLLTGLLALMVMALLAAALIIFIKNRLRNRQ